ncbi:MAG: AAA family ATPase [Sedimentisphaerales bacterium]|nr:AAA family ATPase [Sedimentisphaerales bacterium]
MRTIAIINQKGGCGKTTVAINLASALAGRGLRTLLVDMDPQSHCAVGLAVPEEQIEQSVYDILISHARHEPQRLSEILWQISDNFELAPASIDLAAFDQQMSGVVDRENCLKNLLATVNKDYDYVVIDCPPSVGLLTFNAIRAATDVVVPVEMGYFSLHGLSKQLETLNALCKQCSQQINVMVLASMYDIRTKMGREILGEVRKHFSARMFKTVVNFNTKLKEAASLGQPISEYDPASRGHKDFMSLAEELVGTDTHMHRAELVSSLQAKLDAISASAEELLSTVKPAALVETNEPTEEPQVAPVHTDATEVETAQTPVATLEGASGTVQESQSAHKAHDTKREIVDIEAKPKKSLDAKIAEFYGARQTGDVVTFVTLYPRAQTVQVAGDFNNWQPHMGQLQKVSENGIWQIKLPIASGRYRYRLVVDGIWQQDPYNEMTEMNPYGDFNSVVEVH